MRCYREDMTVFRIREAARVLGVSDDTVRRWIDSGALRSEQDDAGRTVVPGVDLAAQLRADAPELGAVGHGSSARNRFFGIVTAITTDAVMAQVEMQCGPFRVVSLMSAEAVREMELEVGSAATALVKATMVIIETP